MGIVNVTPDSFSDGGRTVDEALAHALRLVEEGADIIDIGGESTRPGATPVSWREEWSRIEPLIGSLSSVPVTISVDTYHRETAELAAGAGADIINCVYPHALEGILALREPYPGLSFVVPSVCVDQLPQEILRDCWIDPMIGFGTTRERDIELLRSIPALARRGRVLVGVSRKRITGYLAGEGDVAGDDMMSVALAMWAVLQGASCVRVHDVRGTAAALSALSRLGNPSVEGR